MLVGPSGCGKSTTLRMVAGLEEISGGELYIDGKLMNDVAPKDRDIAMVFQNYALYPHMANAVSRVAALYIDAEGLSLTVGTPGMGVAASPFSSLPRNTALWYLASS